MKSQVVMDNDPWETGNKNGEFCDHPNILSFSGGTNGKELTC